MMVCNSQDYWVFGLCPKEILREFLLDFNIEFSFYSTDDASDMQKNGFTTLNSPVNPVHCFS
jgi:hypothetical protein